MKIKTADIFVDIIDNFGDMWWVLEFLMMSRLPLSFRIVTDEPMKMRGFLMRSGCELPLYKIIGRWSYRYAWSSDLIILGLHTKVDLMRFSEWTKIIHVSYLMYDPWYRDAHEREHILSTRIKPIIELIYSPLWGTWWVWHYEKNTLSREKWLKGMTLPESLSKKIWIPIFAYPETLRNLDTRSISQDSVVFLVGTTLPESIGYRNLIPSESDTVISLPWLSRDTLWDLIDLADISVLRGEISSLRGLMSGQPYIWDMYKWIWWWNTTDSDGFLEYISATEKYRKIHDQINWWEKWNISDILSVKKEWKKINLSEIEDFSETLEKTIDKIGFSL